MFIRKTVHATLLDAAVAAERKAVEQEFHGEIYDLQARQGELHRKLEEAQRDAKTSRDLVDDMQPLYLIGKKYQANQDAANVRRKAKRAAARGDNLVAVK